MKSHAKYSKREVWSSTWGALDSRMEPQGPQTGALKRRPARQTPTREPNTARELHDGFRGSVTEPLTSKMTPQSRSKHLLEELLAIFSRILASTTLCPAMLRPISKIRPAGIAKRTQYGARPLRARTPLLDHQLTKCIPNAQCMQNASQMPLYRGTRCPPAGPYFFQKPQKCIQKKHPIFHPIFESLCSRFCLPKASQNGAKNLKKSSQTAFLFWIRFFDRLSCLV